MRKPAFFLLFLLAIWAAAATSGAQGVPAQSSAAPGQGGPQQGSGAPAAPRTPRAIEVQQLTPNVYWVKNVGFGAFIVGDNGVIVLDTGGSPATGRQILDAVAKVTPKPVNTLILTHGDGDHVNGIAAFPAGIKIIAQENTKKFLADVIASGETGPETPKVPADHLPNQTVGNREDLTIDGVRMQLLHWAPAHTSGDLVVYLPDQKLVLAGDVIVLDQHDYPLIHMEKGGTSKGWIESVQGMLALDADKYVVGHQGVVGKDALQKQLDKAIAERQQVKELYDEGKSLQQIEAAVNDPDPNIPKPTAGPNFPPYSEVVYTELKSGKF